MAEVLHGNAGVNQLNASADKTQAYGLAGNDTLTSKDKREVLLVGGSGDDRLIMLGGNGTLSGGKGNDTFELNYSADNPISAVIEDLEPARDKIVVNFEGKTAPPLSKTVSGDDVVLQDRNGLLNVTLKGIRENDYFDGTASDEAWEVLKLTNDEREIRGLPLLTMSEGLTEGATIRAQEISGLAELGVLTNHTRPESVGSTPWYTVLEDKYNYPGENLEAGAPSAVSVMTAWMGSEHHRENILDERFNKLGVGYYYHDAGGNSAYRYHWVQLFADSLNAVETVSTAELLTANIENHTVSKSITLSEGADSYNNTIYEATMIAALGGADSIANALSFVSISGGAGADSIEDSGSFVTINAGKGNDFIGLINEAESNLIQYRAGDGSDTITGFNKTDTLSISGAEYTPVSIGNDVVVSVGTAVITLKDAADLSTLNIKGTRSKLYIGTEGNDTYNNTVDGATINGRGGDDTIENSGANVSMNGGNGKDSISNSGTSATIIGGADADTIYNDKDSVAINAGNGKNKITNSGASLTIIGGIDADNIGNEGNFVTITSGAGADHITNSGATASINSGVGDDYINNTSNKVTVISDDGSDTIDNSGASVTIDGGEGEDSISNEGANVSIVGGLDNDYIRNYAASVTIDGGVKDDTIINSVGGSAVSITGGEGNDKITNYAVTVTIDSGTGDDSIRNEGNDSSITGGEGSDTIYNSGASATIDGGNGNDSIDNSAASVTIDSGAHDDKIINSTSGENVLVMSGDGSDTIQNYGAYSTIEGGDGKDYIDSYVSNVTINGGRCNDQITLTNYAINNVIQYSRNDGDDVIEGFRADSTLEIDGGKGKYSSVKSDNDVIIYFDEGSVTLIGAGDLESINVSGVYKVNPDDLESEGEYYYEAKNFINGSAGNENISNDGLSATINGGLGDDTINLSGDAIDNLILYNAGDGNDIINGFRADSTLSIAGGEYTSITSGDDWIFKIGTGAITISGAASLSTVNIDGTEYKPSEKPPETIVPVSVITLDGEEDTYANSLEGVLFQITGGNYSIEISLQRINRRRKRQ